MLLWCIQRQLLAALKADRGDTKLSTEKSIDPQRVTAALPQEIDVLMKRVGDSKSSEPSQMVVTHAVGDGTHTFNKVCVKRYI